MNWKCFYFTIGLLLVNSLFLVAQTRTISGQLVAEKTYEPLVFATVLITNSNPPSVVTTDFDGNFTLEVPANYTQLTFSYIGYKEQTVDISPDGGFMRVQMKEYIEKLCHLPLSSPPPKIELTNTPPTKFIIRF